MAEDQADRPEQDAPHRARQHAGFYAGLSTLLLLLLLVAPAWATTIAAASCSRADVGTAVTATSDGDTVTIPACSQTNWATELTITTCITLQGAGAGSTIIGDNVTKDGTSTSHLVTFACNSPGSFRMTAMTLVGVAVDGSSSNQGHLGLSGTGTFRVDHLTVTTPQTSLIRTRGALTGVIDHVTMTSSTTGRLILQCGHDGWGASAYGDGSWAAALTPGGAGAIYLEDNTYTASSDPFVANVFDALEGCRAVFRYNTLTQANTTSHGTDTGIRERSIRWVEIYNNTFTFPVGMAVDFVHWFRGGSGIFYNNTVTVGGGAGSGWLHFIAKHTNYRDTNATGFDGTLCDGSSPYDGNSVGGTGYRCVDQPGAGTSADLLGSATPIATANALEPIYVWGNTITISGGAPRTTGEDEPADDGHVHVDRDIYYGTARPGWTAYTYPHPLQGGLPPSSSTAAPRNRRHWHGPHAKPDFPSQGAQTP